jgi:ATP-binding cassette, subfamily B, bacterial
MALDGLTRTRGWTESRGSPDRAGARRAGSVNWAELKALLGGRRGAIAGLAIASVMCGLAESGILAITAQSAAALVNGHSHVRISFGPVHATETLRALLTVGALLALLRLALQWVVSVVPANMVTDLQVRLRTDLFAAFIQAPWSQQASDREGHTQELLTSQIALGSQAAVQASTLVVLSLSSLVLVMAALALNVVAAATVLLVALAFFVFLRPLGNLGARYARGLSQASINYAGGANEAVRLAEETHIFGAEAAQRKRLAGLLDAMRRPVFRTQLLARFIPGLYQSLIYLLLVGALAAVVVSGTSHVASLGAVVLLLVRAGTYGQQVQGSLQLLRQSLPFVERVRQAQQRYTDAQSPTGRDRLECVRTLTFERVCFAYDPSRPAISDIDFEVTRGEAVGIIGPTGAGKSTVVQILLALRAPESGRYLVNGIPADRFRREDWHAAFAYVPQEPRLLHASVADNIRFFRPIDDVAVERAGRLAGIHNEIMAWPAGYDTIVGPRADAVSGGQQQRICLARAIAANPEVLVLDEPTSALDPHAEVLIRDSLSSLRDMLTLFVVAHRMSTIDICDRVMVIVDGRLQAFDRIAELELNSAYYRSSAQIGRSTATTFARNKK